jgi:hypothetical protein
VCDDGLFCNGTESCDTQLGCMAGSPPALEETVGCTEDQCDEINDLVVHIPNDLLCANGLYCDGVETCDPVLDCQAGIPVAVDDGVSCTDDGCDAGSGCFNAPIPDCVVVEIPVLFATARAPDGTADPLRRTGAPAPASRSRDATASDGPGADSRADFSHP